jgi:hypothetical protein
MKKRFSVEQIVAVLKQAELGSSAVCVDRSGWALMFDPGRQGAHRAWHEQALPYAGLPRYRNHDRSR